MSKSSTIIILLLLVIVLLLGWIIFVKPAEAPSVPSTEVSSTSDNNPPSTPAPNATPLHEKVVVTYPKANESVPKKFTVTGKAPGNWFFEASAPVMVVTPDSDKVFQGHAETLGDWMTTELVDFKAEVSVNPAYSGPATLVFLKDNPSGLPENDDSLEIPIIVQ